MCCIMGCFMASRRRSGNSISTGTRTSVHWSARPGSLRHLASGLNRASSPSLPGPRPSPARYSYAGMPFGCAESPPQTCMHCQIACNGPSSEQHATPHLCTRHCQDTGIWMTHPSTFCQCLSESEINTGRGPAEGLAGNPCGGSFERGAVPELPQDMPRVCYPQSAV